MSENNTNTAVQQEEWTPKNNPWLIIMPVMLATFMYALDETVANVALPHIAGSYSVSNQESIWVLTSYLMASSIVIPMIDYFCKLLGRKNLFMVNFYRNDCNSACYAGYWRRLLDAYGSGNYNGVL